MYILSANAEKVDAEIWVNDVPVVHLADPNCSDGAFIADRVVLGGNLLRCVVRPGPTPATSLQRHQAAPVTQAEVKVAVRRFGAGSKPGPATGDVLAEITWTSDQIKTDDTWPVVIDQPFTLDSVSLDASWRQAQMLEISGPLRDSVIQFARQIRGWFEEGNVDAIVQAAETAMRDEAIAYGRDPDAHVENFRETIAIRGRASDLAPIVDDEIDLRLVGGGRLVDCRTKDWRPVIRTLPAAPKRFEFSVQVGRLEDRWTLL